MGENIRWNPEDMNEAQRAALGLAEKKEKREKPSKYHVRPKAERRFNGILFASVKEMSYYKDLQLLVKGKALRFFLRQVPFDLPGGVKYRVDFVEFHQNGSVRFVDVKGVKTDMFKVKKKQVEQLYPVTIETE